MDLDLAHVRAFVTAAERLHFGRAAAELFVSQQGLSKRIRRLEQMLGEPLFVRGPHGVDLTAAGYRFLPHARRLLADAAEATADLRRTEPPVRIDVWSEVLAPMRVVLHAMDRYPELSVEISARRSFPAALTALQRREVDAAFGRVHDLGQPWPDELTYRPVLLQAYQVAVSAEHALASVEVVHPQDLRETGVWFPFGKVTPELVALMHQFCDEFGIPVDTSGSNIGLEHILAELRRNPHKVVALSDQWVIAPESGVRMLRLEPVPHLLWSVAWRRNEQHPRLVRFLDYAAELGAAEGWLDFDAELHWLPPADSDDLI